MTRRHPRRPDLLSQINVVPFIDVMLVLLVIFMITAPLIIQTVVELPDAGDVGLTQESKAIEVVVRADGSIFVRDHNFDDETRLGDPEDLVDLVQQRRVLFPGAPVVVSADKSLRYQQVVEVLGRLIEEEIDMVGLNVRTTK